MTTTTHTPANGDYEPPWLIRLRNELPGAESKFGFDFDPVRITRFDRMLSGVANTDRKFELLRIAYNTGLDPNDPMFTFILTVLDMREMYSRDTGEVFESMRKLVEEAKELLRELRREGISIEEKMNRLEETTSEMTQVLEQSVEYSVNAIKAEVDGYVDKQISIKLSERAKAASDTVSEQVEQAAAHATKINEALATSFTPVATAAKKMEKDAITIFGGYKLPRNFGILLGAVSVLTLLLGMSLALWLVNLSGFGLNAGTQLDIRAGQTYRKVYPRLRKASRADIAHVVNQP